MFFFAKIITILIYTFIACILFISNLATMVYDSNHNDITIVNFIIYMLIIIIPTILLLLNIYFTIKTTKCNIIYPLKILVSSSIFVLSIIFLNSINFKLMNFKVYYATYSLYNYIISLFRDYLFLFILVLLISLIFLLTNIIIKKEV